MRCARHWACTEVIGSYEVEGRSPALTRVAAGSSHHQSRENRVQVVIGLPQAGSVLSLAAAARVSEVSGVGAGTEPQLSSLLCFVGFPPIF